MGRGIFSKLCYAFGHFASEGFTSDLLYSCVLEAIRILESIGLKVCAVVSDGASSNRKFYRLYKTYNFRKMWNLLNKPKIKWPHSGPLLVYPSCLNESANVMHVKPPHGFNKI